MGKFTDKQKTTIIKDLEKFCKATDKQIADYKQNSQCFADTKYTKQYLEYQEENKNKAQEVIKKLKANQEINHSLWNWVVCLIALYPFDEDKE